MHIDHRRVRVSSWIGANALNAFAYLALRLAPPIRARAWIARMADLFPRIRSVDEARAMIARLGDRGTCLSRSMAVAARYPGSEVVIGVLQGSSRNPASTRPLDAHAWVEVGGVALGESDQSWAEMGRFRR